MKANQGLVISILVVGRKGRMELMGNQNTILTGIIRIMDKALRMLITGDVAQMASQYVGLASLFHLGHAIANQEAKIWIKINFMMQS